MINGIKKSFGLLAACLNIIFHLSPIKPFLNVVKCKINIEETPGVYVLNCYLNCLIWYIYGKMKSNSILKISNMISGIINLVFLFIYLLFESKRYFCDSLLNSFFIITGTWILYRALILIINSSKLVGFISIGTTLLIFLSPYRKLYKAYKEKHYNFKIVFSPWKYLFSCLFWYTYSFFVKDLYLAISNCVGIIFSLIYIFIRFYFFRRKKINAKKRGSAGNINITGGTNDENKKEEIPIKLYYDSQNQNEDKTVKVVNK